MKTNYNNNLEQIDQLARTVLTDYEVPFESMNWELMEEALDKKYAQPTMAVWFVKGVEALLMVASISAMLYFAKDSTILMREPIVGNSAATQAVSEALIIPQGTTDENAPIEDNRIRTEGAVSSIASLPLAAKTTYSPTTQLARKASVNTTSTTITNSSTPIINTITNTLITPEQQEEKVNGQHINVEAAPTIIRDAAGNIISQQLDAVPQLLPKQTRTVETLETLPNLEPSLLQNTLDIPATFQQRIFAATSEPENDAPYEITKRNFHPFSIGIAGSADYNSVLQNSYDGIKSTQGTGQTVGVRFLYRIAKHFGLETGIFGSFKNYTAAANFATAGLPSQTVQKTSLNIVQIPLNMVIDAFQNPEWRVYAKAGVTYQLVANGNYQWQDGSTTAFNILTNSLSTTPPTVISDRPINNDIFATSKNNSFLLNVGTGFSYRIGRRISLICEPTYQHALKGIGNHADMINTVSVVIGANYVL